MAALIYIAKLVFCSGLLYGYYQFFLRNKRFHHYNRFYLLIITLLSFIIPFIKIPVSLFGGAEHPVLIKTLKVISADGWEEPVVIYANRNAWINWLSLQNILWSLYAAGMLVGLFMLVRSLIWIKKLRHKYPAERLGQFSFYNTIEPGTPFSFFNTIFWNRDIAFNDWKGQQIFRHEAYHVKEKHSADILFMEIACSIAWFNPFFYIVRKELRALHEFLADEYAATPNNRFAYAELLVQQAIAQKNISLAHPFFHTQIKRRILMITKSNLIRHGGRVQRSGYISRIMALPLLFVLVSAFAVKITHSSKKLVSNKTLTVVIDAGHGGQYPGATANGIAEKALTLDISNKIKQLAGSYNLNVVLTRQSDATVGNATELSQDLLNRIQITNDAKADLFISLHVNFATEKVTDKTGFEAYVSGRRTDAKSKQLASVLLTGIKDIYPIEEAIQQREVGVTVLDKSNCPAVLIECGYINNAKDLAFISNAANQEKVARKILEGIVNFSNALTADVSTEKENSVVKVIVRDTIPGKDAKPQSGDQIFTKVEFEADYPGGQTSWIKYLTTNIKYPQAALDKEIKGTVVVQFIVDEKGSVSDVKAISGPDVLKAESIRIIKDSGKWVSAMQNGKKVKSYKRQPITYMLERAKTS